jgi:hypothetical protein
MTGPEERRAHALRAAVLYHKEQSASERRVLQTAQAFEKFINHGSIETSEH